jgi:hypothetical protein
MEYNCNYISLCKDHCRETNIGLANSALVMRMLVDRRYLIGRRFWRKMPFSDAVKILTNDFL